MIKKNKWQITACIILLIIVFVLSLQTFNRANRTDGYDFSSYLLSSKALWEGDNPYETNSQFPYIYPLFLAVIITPLTYVPYWLANLLFLLINISGLVTIYLIITKLFSKEFGSIINYSIPLLVVCIILLDIIQNNLLNGQINIVVLLLSVFFLLYLNKEEYILSSIFLAAAIAIKLTPLIFIFFLLKRKRFKELGLTFLFTVFFIFAIPYMISGSETTEYYKIYLNKLILLSNDEIN